MTGPAERPGFDADAEAALAALPTVPALNDQGLSAFREANSHGAGRVDAACAALGLIREDYTIPGPGGALTMTVIRPDRVLADAPLYYTIHGGGMVAGSRFLTLAMFEELEWVADHGMVLITPEYRLAPESPAPAGVEDCYAGLVWAASRASEWGADPARLIVAGASGGGGLAAGVVLMARDRPEVTVMAQLLIYPMLDDRNETVSARQYAGAAGATWPRESNMWAWTAVRSHGQGGDDPSGYIVPARATDLSGLPSTFIDVGSAEVFRDECVAFASRLWSAGVQAELHVWRGGIHGFDLLAPTSAIARAARAARADWLCRILAQDLRAALLRHPGFGD